MATLAEKVEGYVGTFSDTGSLTSWLVQSVTELVNMLPVTVLEFYSTTLPDTGSGVAVAGYKVTRAHKSGYSAQIIDAGLKARTADTGSIYFATNTSPTAYIENGKGYIKPSGGSFIAFQYPTLTSVTIADSTQFLKDFEDYIIIPVAVRACAQLLSTARTAMASYTDSDQDVELTMAKANEIERLDLLLKDLQSQYTALLNNLK
jgi:hypothetical protein